MGKNAMSSDALYAKETNPNKLGLTRLLGRPRRPFVMRTATCETCSPGNVWTNPVSREESPEVPFTGICEAAEKGEAFSFWDDPSEDIYHWSDGEEI